IDEGTSLLELQPHVVDDGERLVDRIGDGREGSAELVLDLLTSRSCAIADLLETLVDILLIEDSLALTEGEVLQVVLDLLLQVESFTSPAREGEPETALTEVLLELLASLEPLLKLPGELGSLFLPGLELLLPFLFDQLQDLVVELLALGALLLELLPGCLG